MWRWDWNGHAVLLSLQERKYVAVRIMPIARAGDCGRRTEKLEDDTFKARMADCVERRDNGDVVIRNIPMVDQGPQGLLRALRLCVKRLKDLRVLKRSGW